eukprot:COSAG03_NODE_610_length_6719_cov_12.568841_4_plen_195_part_00
MLSHPARATAPLASRAPDHAEQRVPAPFPGPAPGAAFLAACGASPAAAPRSSAPPVSSLASLSPRAAGRAASTPRGAASPSQPTGRGGGGGGGGGERERGRERGPKTGPPSFVQPPAVGSLARRRSIWALGRDSRLARRVTFETWGRPAPFAEMDTTDNVPQRPQDPRLTPSRATVRERRPNTATAIRQEGAAH